MTNNTQGLYLPGSQADGLSVDQAKTVLQKQVQQPNPDRGDGDDGKKRRNRRKKRNIFVTKMMFELAAALGVLLALYVATQFNLLPF